MKKSEAEIKADKDKDADERTTHVGLFHYAASYWVGARTLANADERTTLHPDAPVKFLYYHAIELYLKAFLRFHGHSVSDLSRNFGHQAGRLSRRAIELGLIVKKHDKAIFDFMASTDVVIQSRYIVTGTVSEPPIRALEKTCQSLHQNVGTAAELSARSLRIGNMVSSNPTT